MADESKFTIVITCKDGTMDLDTDLSDPDIVAAALCVVLERITGVSTDPYMIEVDHIREQARQDMLRLLEEGL